MTETVHPANIATISQLLNLSGSQYRLYDVGRRVEKLSKDLFEKVELNQLPYPTPSQGHAHVAIAFWQKKSSQPYLWLLKLPLDERGLLNQGARNHFIAIIVEALGADLNQETSKEQEEILNENPYLFTPAQYKMASLNSKIKVDLKQQPSEYLSPFLHYLSKESDWDEWQAVGVQGITDFAARINQDKHVEILQYALPNLPNEVLLPLCGALENETYHVDLITALLSQLKLSLEINNDKTDNSQLQQHLLRALAANSDHPHMLDFITKLLAQEKVSPELLITLSGRCWLALADEKRLMSYFEHLVASDDSPLFNSIFKDLVALPLIRPIVFQCMRSPKRSPKLAQAIGKLFNRG